MPIIQSAQMQIVEPALQANPQQDGALSIVNVWAGARIDNAAAGYFGLVDQTTTAPLPALVGMRIWFPISPGGIVNWSPPGVPAAALFGYRFAQGLWLVFSSTPQLFTPMGPPNTLDCIVTLQVTTP